MDRGPGAPALLGLGDDTCVNCSIKSNAQRHYSSKRSGLACLLVGFVCIAITSGCQMTKADWDEFFGLNNSGDGSGSTTKHGITIPSENERDDIIRVVKIINTNPWLKFDPLGSKVDGFRCTLYLSAPVVGESGREGEKGVFGAGTIIVQMFAVEFDKNTKRDVLREIHKWELDRDEAYKYRAKKAEALGWGYGLRLRWPDGLDVAGQKVAFHMSYRRQDGGVIPSSRPTIRRVPVSGV